MLFVASLLLASAPFSGTLTFEVENGRAPIDRVIDVGANTLFVREGGDAYFVDETGAHVARNELGVLVEHKLGNANETATATDLPDRTIGGRQARCVRAMTAPDSFLTTPEEAIDHVDLCLLPDERRFSFRELDLGKLDADSIFAKKGLRGLPALVSMQTKTGKVFARVSLKTIAARPVSPTLLASLPPLDPKVACANGHKKAVRDVLRALFVAEVSWFADHGAYAPDLATLDFVTRPRAAARGRIVTVDANHFVVEAIGQGAHEGEVWRIDDAENETAISAAPCP